MEEIRKIILSLIILSLMSVGWGFVQLEIENVNVNADNSGTLDIYMYNIPSCSYCEDAIYNYNTNNWQTQKELCESPQGGNSFWVVDINLTESQCADVPSIDETGGWWFDGYVSGYQFFIDGVTATSLFGGTSEYFDFCDVNPNADCDCDTIVDEGCNLILCATFIGETIPPSTTSQLLVSINFEDFNDIGICFAGTEIEFIHNNGNPQCSDGDSQWDAGSWSPPEIAGSNGAAVPFFLGDCHIPSYEILGCTYIHATNYNPDATDDDGSCDFMWGDVNHDGQLTIQDLILIVNEILNF